jgi:guanine deaminase
LATQKLNFYIGSILNPQNDKKCDYLPHGLIVTEKNGKNVTIKEITSVENGVKKFGPLMNSKNTIDFGQSVIMPGFFDMHFHWVQDDVREMPKDSLLGWLEKYTFPTEMKFSKKAFAQEKAKIFFKKLSDHGTLGGACYSSIHEHAIDAAFKKVQGHFVIGNVLMNMYSPEKLTQSESESLLLTKKLIKKYGKKHCFTPRFAITTTPKVMKEGSRMADKAGCYKQTHLSETPQEIEFVLSIYKKIPGFEKVKSYTEIYAKTGMLGEKSLMGHGIHLSSKELTTLRKTKTSLIHCPTSNAPLKEKGLGSGLFDFRKVEKAKVRWALGSDIGGGPFLSMFDVIRSFVQQNNNKEATFIKGLYRSTLAGAEILGLKKQTGNLNKGKEASFIVIPLPKAKFYDAETLLKSLILPHSKRREKYTGLVERVYLNGKLMSSNPSAPV